MLAQAVAAGDDALCIDGANKNEGWTTVTEAVQAGRCFAVNVRDGILAVDADMADAARLVDELRKILEAHGHEAVIVKSGQEGRRHLFAALNDPDLGRMEDEARSLGLDVRKVIRPPLAPHRLGLKPRLVHPLDPEEALKRLLRTSSTRRRAWVVSAPNTRQIGPQDSVRAPRCADDLLGLLSDKIAELVRSGQHAGSYQSRSEAIHAVLVMAAARGFTTEEVLQVMSEESFGITEKLLEMDEDAAEQWLLRDWDKAQQMVRDSLDRLSEYLKVLHGYDWPKSGKLRTTYEAVLHVMARSDVSAPYVSARTAALVIGCRPNTASGNLSKLVECGLLCREDARRVGHAPRYLPMERPDTHASTPPRDYLLDDFMNRLRYPPGEDVWRQQALGHTAREVFLSLLMQEADAMGLAANLSMHRKTADRHLEALEATGLVSQAGGAWAVNMDANVDFGGLAETLGSRGKQAQAKERAQIERQLYADYCRERRKAWPRTQDPSRLAAKS